MHSQKVPYNKIFCYSKIGFVVIIYKMGVKDLFMLFAATKVYALVGRSGTGKSFRAKLIAQNYNIDYIIDDGLLIYKNSIIGGRSAKKEDLYLKAIKTAIFDNPQHRKEIASLIKTRKIKKILLIGTSEKMVNIICQRMKLPAPCKVIHIEEISSQEEIARAIESRTHEGKHVIPVPIIEIKKNYPTIIAESLQLFFKNKVSKKNKGAVIEKSVVRPSFTTQGAVSITEPALAQMIYHCADEFNDKYKIKKLIIKPENGSFQLRIKLMVPATGQIASELHEFQQYIITSIQKYTGIILSKVDLEITELN